MAPRTARGCAIGFAASGLRARAEELAVQLHLPVVQHDDQRRAYAFLLMVTAQRLELRFAGTGEAPAPGPVYVDFVAGRSAYRRKQGGRKSEAIARACGLQKLPRPTVIDATAGLARDAFVLASLGCRITLIERSAIVAALLEDGLHRAKLAGETPAIIDNMHLVKGDSVDFLHSLAAEANPDVIYLDPMYPSVQKKNKSLVKKEQQVLRALLGCDGEVTALLQIALQRARQRVVLKRPRRAAVLFPQGAENLQYTSLPSGNTRFDIFFPQSGH